MKSPKSAVINFENKLLLCRESLGTLNRRAFDAGIFMIVTDPEGHRVTLNKTSVQMIQAAQEKPVTKKVK